MQARAPTATPPALAYTVREFCAGNKISKSHFYALIRDGLGPRLMRVGGRVLISHEAAAEWRRQMEGAA